jgi:hypothetical protein
MRLTSNCVQDAINAPGSRTSQDAERFELPGPAKTQKPEHPSSARLLDTESLRPNRNLFECNNPASAAPEFGLRGPSGPRIRHASGPRIEVRGRLQFLLACCHSEAASPLEESAPKQRVPVPFGRCASPTVAELRRPPAGKSVKSETVIGPGVERRLQYRTPSQTPRDSYPRV